MSFSLYHSTVTHWFMSCRILSDEGLTFETSSLETLYGGQFTFSHHVASTSHHVASTSHHVASASHHVASTSHHVASTSHHVASASHHVASASHHVASTSHHVASTSHHVASTSHHVASTSHHVASASHHVASTSHHVASTSHHVASASHHVASTSHHVASTSHHVASTSHHVASTSMEARNLAVVFDDHLTMSSHINSICRSASLVLRNVGRVRKYLDQANTERLVHAFITSRLDYCFQILHLHLWGPSFLSCRAQTLEQSASKY